MSTKIYNGRIIRNATLEQAFFHMEEVRRKLRADDADEAILLLARIVLRKMTKKLLGFILAETPTPPLRQIALDTIQAWGEAWKDIDERIRKISETRRRDSEVDFDTAWVLIPDGKDVLLLRYAEQERHEEEIDLATADFHYQDQTDPPDDLSVEEWAERKRRWGRVFSGNLSPAEVGVEMRLHATFAIPCLFTLRDKEQRVEAIKRLWAEEFGTEWGSILTRAIRSVLHTANFAAKNTEGGVNEDSFMSAFMASQPTPEQIEGVRAKIEGLPDWGAVADYMLAEHDSLVTELMDRKNAETPAES